MRSILTLYFAASLETWKEMVFMWITFIVTYKNQTVHIITLAYPLELLY